MRRPRAVAIIQARMGSSRLPGKVLADIAGKPMLQHVIERAAEARSLDAVVVATTDTFTDDPIADLCAGLRVPCHRGSEHDVLDRVRGAAQKVDADIVARITADCPLLDGAIIDACVGHLTGSTERFGAWDFVSNRLPPPWKRTYPIGLDVECCWRAVLERAAAEAVLPHQREHVMPFIYENARICSWIDGDTSERENLGDLFNVLVLELPEDLGWIRWTVDTPEDLAVIRGIYASISPNRASSWRDVLRVTRSHPHLLHLNADVMQRSMRDVDERSDVE